MNLPSRFLFSLAVVSPGALWAQTQPAPEPPPPVVQAPAQAAPSAPRAENQRLYGPASATIVPAAQAEALVAKFREVYARLGSPRLLFYVNRELVDTASGMKLTGRTERYENSRVSTKRERDPSAAAAPAAVSAPPTNPQTQVNVHVGPGGEKHAHAAVGTAGNVQTETSKTSGENTYTFKEPAKPTLADRQTVREVERLFGRTFRAAGAVLADQKVAADLIADKPLSNLAGTSDQAAKDRAALAQVADVVVEILLSSRAITVPAVSGDQSLTVPDIQATAIRLKDSAILGQAAASDVLGKDRDAGNLARTFDVRDITEATALALMEDWLGAAK